MVRGDIPLSAIDFHCSSISDDLQQVRRFVLTTTGLSL